jgi:hypothetical protein
VMPLAQSGDDADAAMANPQEALERRLMEALPRIQAYFRR